MPKPIKISITLEPDVAAVQEFLDGLILAKGNNNSQYFPKLITAVNTVMSKWKAEVGD